MALNLPALDDGDALGMTVAEVLAEVLASLGWTSATATNNRVYRAVTNAGLAAQMYEGRKWWWVKDTGTFTTVDGTASYSLRSSFAALHVVESVYYNIATDSVQRLKEISFLEYQNRLIIDDDEGDPVAYAIAGNQTIYLHPTPDTSSKTVTVNYTKRHPKISATAADVDLIVPAEWHYSIYVQTVVWIARHDWADPAATRSCPAFIEAMRSMGEADAAQQDDFSSTNKHLGQGPGWMDPNSSYDEDGARIDRVAIS